MKILKIIGTILIIFAGVIFLMITLLSEILPEGRNKNEADKLAEKMLLAVNDSAWQKTGAVSWGFKDHRFIWDRERHFVQVKFDKNEILIDINNRRGVIIKEGRGISESEKSDLCKQAWKLWVNDSFWLNPVSKCKDEGTTRSLVKLDDGRNGLMVNYSSGGGYT